MNQELEIEFKNILTKEEFLTLTKAFSVMESQFHQQTNYYFDTKEFSLKEKAVALRIRYKKNTYTLTLKQTVVEGILETHQPITKEEALQMIDNLYFPNGDIKNLLYQNEVNPEKVLYFGSLTTNRAETTFEEGVLVFDHSNYLQHEDYELEYEVTNRQTGQTSFLNLLNEYHIPNRPTENKMKRFFNIWKRE